MDPPIITRVVSGVSERERVITTYRAEGFEEVLRELGLLEQYPLLGARLRFGFPLGDMSPLVRTFTPDNHKAGVEHLDFIQEYLDEQVALGHMTGPYSRERVEEILEGPFRTSPLAVTEKPGSKSGWRLIQNCSFEDEYGVSVNSMIDSDDFPTKWGTAAQVAEVVSLYLFITLDLYRCIVVCKVERWSQRVCIAGAGTCSRYGYG